MTAFHEPVPRRKPDPPVRSAHEEHPAEPLDGVVRARMETAFGTDFSRVRVHTHPHSQLDAQIRGARAFTEGEHLTLGPAAAERTNLDLLAHELAHVLQSRAAAEGPAAHTTAVEAQADRMADDAVSGRQVRETPLPAAGPRLQPVSQADRRPPPDRTVDVISLSYPEYEALTGQRAADVPEGVLPGLPPAALSRATSGIPAAAGAPALFIPEMNWYYRVLASTDPSAVQLLGGANLTPRPPDPGSVFKPAATEAEMTFRHLRPGGNVPKIGTDRISTGNLAAFEKLLVSRGTGELVRIDVEAARRLGARFLEHGEIMAQLEQIGRDLAQQLAAARSAGRGKTFIAKLESRLVALERAKEYARGFGEGQGVGVVPSKSISQVKGPNMAGAVAGEKAFLRGITVLRYGGRVLLVVGAGMSVARIATAPEAERGRVAAQEGGGWAFSLAAGAAGAEGGAAAGAALGWETGPGAVVAVVLGSLIGGALGFFGGQELLDKAYDATTGWADEAGRREFEHFQKLNPGATPTDYDRLQQAQENFDTWGAP